MRRSSGSSPESTRDNTAPHNRTLNVLIIGKNGLCGRTDKFNKFINSSTRLRTDALEAFFEMLAGYQRWADYHSVLGMMPIEFHRHTIFYTIRDTDILIAPILPGFEAQRYGNAR
jgi:toxin ParE1/3/4